MIEYTEKGAGLHEAIQKAKLSLREENGVWVSSHDEKTIQDFINVYSIADAANYICLKIDSLATDFRDKAIKGVSVAEISSWSTKATEAEKLNQSKNIADAPSLVKEAFYRGISVDELANKVIVNFNTSADLEASIAGIAGKHKDAVRSLQSFDEINQYDYSSGWPVK